MQLVKLFQFFLILFFSLISLASEHGGGAEADKSKEGAQSVSDDYSGKQNQKWSDIQTKLTTLKGKLDAQEAVVKALKDEKESVHKSIHENTSERLENLKKENQKWMDLLKEYNILSEEYEMRFPEKGIKENRIYKRSEHKSLEVQKPPESFDDKLNRIQQKVLKQYPKSAEKIVTERQNKLKLNKSKSKKNDQNEHMPVNKNTKKDILIGPKNESTQDGVSEEIILQK